VLAYLALQSRPVTRDHLAAVFWGGKDDVRARNSLSDAISHLRRVLGRDAIVTRGDEVALAMDAALSVDAVDLCEAATAQAWARVTQLYDGAFLDGVHIDDAHDFDHWIAGQDARMRRLFGRACAECTRVLVRDQEWEPCARLAERWLAAEPLSADAAFSRIQALQAPATTEAFAAALVEYDRLRARLAEDFGVGVDQTVERLVASVRALLPPVVSPAQDASPALALGPVDEPKVSSEPISITPSATVARRDSPRDARRRRHWARVAALLIAPIVLAGSLARRILSAAADGSGALAVAPATKEYLDAQAAPTSNLAA
jgi:DNA-binding SARP family transcriptional activator